MTTVRGLGVLALLGGVALGAPACGHDSKPGQGGSTGGSSGRGSGGAAGKGTGGSSSAGKSGAAGSSSAGKSGSTGGSSTAGEGGESGDGAGATGGSAGASGGAAGKGGRGGSAGGGGSSGDAGSGGEGGEMTSGPVRDPRCDDAIAGELQGSGTSLDPFLLCLPEQVALLDTVSYQLSQEYALGDELDFTSVSGSFLTFTTTFAGTLDGRLHAMTNLPAALFTLVGGLGEVRDLSVSGDVDASAESTRWGLLARTNSGLVRRVRASGTFSVGDHVGILVGYNDGEIEDCSSSGAITDGGSHVGGLVGVNLGTVRRSSSTATVSAGQRVGGLVGRQTTPGVIEQSYALGAVTGGAAPGGLVGTLFSGEVRNCYARSPSVTGPEAGGLVGDISGSAADGLSRVIENCYATSTVSGTGAEGLVGTITSDPLYTITSSYFLDTATGTNGTSRTNAQMMTQATYVGWNFSSIWQLDPAISSYPSLAFETP